MVGEGDEIVVDDFKFEIGNWMNEIRNADSQSNDR